MSSELMVFHRLTVSPAVGRFKRAAESFGNSIAINMSRFFGSSSAAAKKKPVATASNEAEERRKAFFEFCETDDADMVLAHILETPHLLHARDGDDNMSALEIAAGFNASKTIRVLVENGHELNVRDDAGRTALAYAWFVHAADLRHRAASFLVSTRIPLPPTCLRATQCVELCGRCGHAALTRCRCQCCRL